MKTKFTYDDVVLILPNTIPSNRIGERAWIVGVFETRPKGDYFKNFPKGVVYSIEFEDGCSMEIHENDLQFESI